MKKKVNLTQYWVMWSLAIFAVIWIILVHNMDMSHWVMLPIIVIYLIVNAFIFKSYYYGLAGTYYLYTGRPEKAFKLYELAIKHNTRFPQALYHWGLKLLQEGKGKEALTYFEKAQKVNTKKIMEKDIILATSSCYWIMGEIDKAIEVLENLMHNYSYMNPSALTTLGYLYFLKGDYNNAEKYSLDALKDTPEQASAWDNLGQIYFAQNEISKAKENFNKALEYKPKMPDSLYYMGKISELENDLTSAKDYYTKAAECNISALNTVTKEQITESLNNLNK